MVRRVVYTQEWANASSSNYFRHNFSMGAACLTAMYTLIAYLCILSKYGKQNCSLCFKQRWLLKNNLDECCRADAGVHATSSELKCRYSVPFALNHPAFL